MIARVIKSDDGITRLVIAIGVTAADGSRTTPTAAVVRFYRVNQTTGALELDAVLGQQNLVEQDSRTGFYGAAIDITNVDAGEFVVLAELTVGGIDTVAVDSMSLYEDLGGQVGAPQITVVPGPDIDVT